MNPLIRIIVAVLVFCGIAGCETNDKITNSIINPDHLNSLYEEIKIEGQNLGIIHIYSEFPDYEWVGDEDEGIACIDDICRAAVFYMQYSKTKNDKISREKAKKLLEFVLFMQSDNGYFYNFIQEDLTINKSFKTSVPEPNWWTWRALWSLTEGYKFFLPDQKEFADSLLTAINSTLSSIKSNFPLQKDTLLVEGMAVPTWLPNIMAGDQAALLVMSLIDYYAIFKDKIIFGYIEDLCEGIILMQIKDASSFTHGAFLSWQNIWHGYGNLQSFALLKAYEIIRNEKYLNAALLEINNFYRYLIEEKYLSSFIIRLEEKKVVVTETNKFPQIAYELRPMIYACLKAFEIIGDSNYAIMAGSAALWFAGDNPADSKMYNIDEGICYDGIMQNRINQNSGAESTIETLLALLAVERNPIALKIFENYISNKKIPE